MSAKMKFANIKVAKKTRSRARISSNSCCKKTDSAVEGIQEAGRDLCKLFCQLKDADNAAALVRAIRCKNRKVVDSIIGDNCSVVCFFNQGRSSCVRISCVFGECCDVRITFDICVSNGQCNIL
ncbi:hypothetical protein ACFOLF_15275 [Paenibacillus sepulcri]|uniref:Uncharacterized protein n=1 Tax=Paenibacillus sepulcri TaxID=359917 RepID=A0ABS7CEV1_9BACL|nr:hypothetical protein [Paenibacillus sepulcri]